MIFLHISLTVFYSSLHRPRRDESGVEPRHHQRPPFLSPQELERQWIPNDSVDKPLYRVPYHIIHLEN
ncbi:hypothetical protein M427DRAFT_151470 [Gonapodya prolifera JEL478]|uniref:Uncharacterized protein n=1 Tax=Gonapodya prolifera (strain JEL478) TaxID=1344416 RepID=A0A139AY00_GONPJ|nr:hypothetical protein M427DRAFT_151470 [Gonapodya prolifera JEL478]|eukprot:KXS21443.1 hypothetical protein M427DRAFT_151470 [Gonapodya prolifera JEL478]